MQRIGMSKHKNRRKVRTPAVRVDFGREQILSGMHVSADGTLTFFDENGQRVSPANVEVDSTYPRKKGSKTLARVVSNPDKIVLDQNRALSRYDYLFAIDTNTKVVNSVKTSMTVACLIQDVRIENPRWHANLVEQNAIEFQEISEAAEKVGWCEFLAVIKKIRTSGINWVNS